MNTFTAGLTRYKRTIVTKRDGTCTFCAEATRTGVDYAAVTPKGKWLAVCQACAISIPAQVNGVVRNLEALAEGGLDINLDSIDMDLLADVQAGIAADGVAYDVLCALGYARNAAQAAAPVATSGLDLSSVPSGTYAVPGGDTRLKVRIDNVTKGKWAGWTFVKDGAEYGQGQRYGSQKPGATYKGQIEDALRAIVADIAGAAKAYAALTDRCSFCNLPLEDERSVDAGYGPTCAKKHGLPWG